MSDSFEYPTEFRPDSDLEYVLQRRTTLPPDPPFQRQIYFGEHNGQTFALVQDQVLPLDDDEQQTGYPLVSRVYLMRLGGAKLLLETNDPLPNIMINRSFSRPS